MKQIALSSLLIFAVGCSKPTSHAENNSLAVDVVGKGALPLNNDIFLEMGTETGNGGGVVVCRNSTTNVIEKAELLDFYEARVVRKLKLDLGAEDLDFKIKIQNVLNRIKQHSPVRGAKYQRMYDSFFAEAAIIPDANLTYIDDAASVVIPVGCAKEQASIVRNPEFPEDARYIISKILWDKLDNNSKAGLVLHEIIYQEGISLGQQNSKAVRYFVGKITSNEAASYNKEKFDALIAAVKFSAYDFYGTLVTKSVVENTVSYETDKSNFFADMNLPKRVAYGNLVLNKNFVLIFLIQTNTLRYAIGVIEVTKGTTVIKADKDSDFSLDFTADGNLSILKGSATDKLSARFNNFELKLRSTSDYWSSSFSLLFDENELPKYWTGILESKNPSRQYDSGPLYADKIEADETRTINENGILLKAYLLQPRLYNSPQGQLIFGPNGQVNGTGDDTRSYFNKDGMLIRGSLQEGQMIRLADGRYKKYINPLLIEFDHFDLAIVVLYGYYRNNSGSTHMYDGCDLRDFSKVEKLIKNSGSLQNVIRDREIELTPGSITVMRVTDYKYTSAINYSLPTFAVHFRDKKGDEYSIEMLRGSESLGGVSLEDTAYLNTDKLANGTINRSCSQAFYNNGYSYSGTDARIKNITKDYSYSIVKLDLSDVTETH